LPQCPLLISAATRPFPMSAPNVRSQCMPLVSAPSVRMSGDPENMKVGRIDAGLIVRLINVEQISHSHQGLASNRHRKIPNKPLQMFASQTEVGRLLEVHFIGGETYARKTDQKELQTVVVHRTDYILLRQSACADARSSSPACSCARPGPFEFEFVFSQPAL